jgi:hypothetical protein
MQKQELYDLYSSPNIIQVINSGRMRGMGHVAHMEDRRGIYRVWWGNLRESNQLEDLGVYGRIILKWMFKKRDGRAGTGLIWLRIRTGCRLL